jgi:undecaprenyl-diphosphatase
MPILQRLPLLLARVGRRELAILAMVLVPAGLTAGFLALASEVAEGETTGFDKAILLGLRNRADLADPIGPPWVEAMMKDITALGGVTILTLITLCAVGFLLVAGKRTTALLAIVAVVGGTLLSNAMKLIFARPRPDLVAHSVDVHTPSFPSGHAMLSAVIYLTLGALIAGVARDPRRRLYVLGVAVLLTLAIGVSRVYLGVHYPTDVLAGWAAGAVWAMLCLGGASLLRGLAGKSERG